MFSIDIHELELIFTDAGFRFSFEYLGGYWGMRDKPILMRESDRKYVYQLQGIGLVGCLEGKTVVVATSLRDERE